MVENGINIKAAATRDSVPKFCVMAIKLKFNLLIINMFEMYCFAE